MMGLQCDEKTDPGLGHYFDLGTVGHGRVLAIKTRMGTVDFRAATSQAILFQARTGARRLIAMGMAFGLDRTTQNFGEVLVAESIFPYDIREMLDSPSGPVFDYKKSDNRRRPASKTLVTMVQAGYLRAKPNYRVSFGTLLSGGARISSTQFRDALVNSVPPGTQVIGGDMEGVGLLSVSRADWLVVKGISDFAESPSGNTHPDNRALACRNSIALVLASIVHHT